MINMIITLGKITFCDFPWIILCTCWDQNGYLSTGVGKEESCYWDNYSLITGLKPVYPQEIFLLFPFFLVINEVFLII